MFSTEVQYVPFLLSTLLICNQCFKSIFGENGTFYDNNLQFFLSETTLEENRLQEGIGSFYPLLHLIGPIMAFCLIISNGFPQETFLDCLLELLFLLRIGSTGFKHKLFVQSKYSTVVFVIIGFLFFFCCYYFFRLCPFCILLYICVILLDQYRQYKLSTEYVGCQVSALV